MHKCETCGKEFNTEEGLNSHKTAVHGLNRHEKRELKKKHEEKRKEEIHGKIKKKKTTRNMIITVVVIVAIVLIYWIVANSNNSGSNMVSFEGSSNSMGLSNASVVMVEYSDFQCPYCGRFYTQTESQIIDSYVTTGKIRLVYKHFPLSQAHAYAEKAAEASECAADQGMFWEYHNKLFENQNSLYLTSLKSYADSLGLDTTQFNSCLDSGSKQSIVSNDYKEGISLGVQSTPTFFINGVKIEGARPFSVFQNTIDAQLKK